MFQSISESSTAYNLFIIIHFEKKFSALLCLLDFVLTSSDVQKHCYKSINRTHGIITSPNYPFFNPYNSSCTYVITSAEEYLIVLRWRDFDLPPKVNGHCQDSITVYDGQIEGINQYLFTPICGRHDFNTFDFTSSGNQLSIVVKANIDQPDIQIFRGFKAIFYPSMYILVDEDYDCMIQ